MSVSLNIKIQLQYLEKIQKYVELKQHLLSRGYGISLFLYLSFLYQEVASIPVGPQKGSEITLARGKFISS